MAAPVERVVETVRGLVKTRVLVAGSGPAVVWLHGSSGLDWDPFLDALSDRCTVFAPEHPGSGESSGIEHLYSLMELVFHYDELFDELDLPAAAVAGHSFGAMVGAELAALARSRVTRLALLAPIGLWRDDHPVIDLDSVPRNRRPELLMADPARPLPALLDPPLDDPMALYHADLTAASLNQFIWPLPDKGLERRLYRITAPTLLLWGAADRIVDPSYAPLFGAQLRHHRAEVLAGLGHLLHCEDPARVAGVVSGFLTES